MLKINDNFQKLPGGYLFPEIARRVKAFSAESPSMPIIRLGIGDVTRPLASAVIDAMHKAVDEMGHEETFRGYCDEIGYDFLRSVIAENDYKKRGVDIGADEIYISDGAKSDCGNIGDLFALDNIVAVCDPVYPVYVDTNAMAGRAGNYSSSEGKWSDLIYLPCTAENDFFPDLPGRVPDIIYICSPNNPTGAAATYEQLKLWVDYANKNGSLILFDSAYEAFISDPKLPHSIFEIPGAETCAIEFRSFSKTAGFTGTRCAYTVISKYLERGGVKLGSMWNRRQCTKFNGVPYIVQRAAEAVYTPEGHAQIMDTINYYHENAKIILSGLKASGLEAYGGVNAPYIWFKAPDGAGSWEFFDILLRRACVVTTPGSGFGPSGEGYIRVTAFGSRSNTEIAVQRIQDIL